MGCDICKQEKVGGHYNSSTMRYKDDDGVEHSSWECLRGMFPNGNANDLNFVLFSTSGVHGMYTTIEEIEHSLTKYGPAPEFMEDPEINDDPPHDVPDDYSGGDLTVLIVHPRLASVRYGNIKVSLEDIPYLKKLRQSSWDVVQKIGQGN